MNDLEPRVPHLCTMGFGLVGGFPKVTDSSSLRTGRCCLVFGDFKAFDSQKPSSLTLACPLPCLSFPELFPLRLEASSECLGLDRCLAPTPSQRQQPPCC